VAARSKARKRALEVLYEAEIRREPPADVLSRRAAATAAEAGQPLAEQAFVDRLVAGVAEHRDRIDELIATYSVGWTLDRMPMVDRNVLRLGAYELLWNDEVPDGVAISEAVALATELSTDESPRFVNGLLSRLLELKPSLSL
jgi:N utilization substance protein B